VHLKVATSADGAVAAAPGARTPISGSEAARWTQRLRGAVDAIAIGAGTALVDDPLLTTRDVYRHRPLIRVVFDRRLRLPPSSRLARTATEAPVWVLTAPERLESVEAGMLRALAVEVIGVDAGTVGDSLQSLAQRGVHSLLVEGGPSLHRACWEAGVADRVSQIVADVSLGPDAVRWNLSAWSNGRALRTVPLGRDVLLEADVHGTD
jgi:diaminohydroxyphosphoribosylaminopyrimidine deaminase / 5-amino-6-(5-phosphoribosylamino)uracil reductase